MTHRTDQTGRADGGLNSAPSAHHEFEILGTVPVGVLVLSGGGSLLYANSAAYALFGSAGEPLALADTLCPVDGRELQEHLQDGSQFEATVISPPCQRQVMVSVARLQAGEEEGFVVSMTDVTALKLANDRAEFLAHHDPLTQLGNRTLLQAVWDALEERLGTEGAGIHAMALDLDRFKEVNDEHGHGIGDLVLSEAATRIRSAVGDAGHVFRFGGDEFFALIYDVPHADALEIGRRITAEVRRPITVHGHEIAIGCSVGVSSSPRDGTTRDALHRAADLALYQVKRAGRGGVACFDPTQEQALLDRRLLQADLILAMANDGLQLVFQPQFNSRTDELEGVEACVSWTNARTGRAVDRNELTTLAGATGLSHLVDLWVLRTAVAQLAELGRSMSALPTVSVAMMGATLTREDTADLIAKALAANGLAADRLEILIAESSVQSGGDELGRAIERLGALGVRIAIDEFWASRSSLRFLRSLGVGRVKFDRNIAARIVGDADAEALVASLWTFCQKLGIQLSADGIETAEQLSTLRHLSRVRAQGPLFDGRSLPYEADINESSEEVAG